MAEKLTVRHFYINTEDGSIIHETILPWIALDGFIKASINMGAQKIEITYLKTKDVYEIVYQP